MAFCVFNNTIYQGLMLLCIQEYKSEEAWQPVHGLDETLFAVSY